MDVGKEVASGCSGSLRSDYVEEESADSHEIPGAATHQDENAHQCIGLFGLQVLQRFNVKLALA